MTISFNADEILQMAEQIERNGVKFYSLAAERGATSYDPDNQNGLYLQAMADREVFKLDQDPRKLLPSSVTLAGVIDIAIGKEKDSIVFYAGMKELVSEKLGGWKINSIISEEFRHIAVLRGIAIKN